MIVLGIDPSSKSLGWAVVIDGVPVNIGVWVPTPKSAKPSQRILQCFIFLAYLFATYRPDEVVMEVIRVSTSHDTTRSLSRHEGLVVLNAMLIGAHIHEHQVGEARAAVFGAGKGNTSKRDAHALMRMRYPELPWLEMDSGVDKNGKPKDGPGLDQSDALVAALARDVLAQRVNGKASKRTRSKSGS